MVGIFSVAGIVLYSCGFILLLEGTTLSVSGGGSPRTCKGASGGGGVKIPPKRYKVRPLGNY